MSAQSLGRTLLFVAGITFVVALAGVGARATYGAQVTADEPQYLITALSIGEDLNLDISDELAEERFLDFHEIPLDPQTLELDDFGQQLSPHDPGLPLLLAIPMRLGGWQLAKVALAAVAAATAALTAWVSVRRFDVGVQAAAVVSVAMFTTPPLTGYATQVYPEMPAAFLVLVGVAAVVNPAGRPLCRARQVAALVAVIALPWFAVKYAPVAAVLAVALLFSFRDQENPGSPADGRAGLRLGASMAILAVAGALYLLIHQRVYGGWTVYASGDHFVDGEFLVVGNNPNYFGRSQRLLGLLIDRQFGLVAWAPAYVMAVPALAALTRRRMPGWLLPGALFAAAWAVATWVALTMHGWWWPGRQVVVVLPIVAVGLASFVDGRPRLLRTLIGLSALGLLNWLWLVFETSTNRRTLIVDFAETSSPLYQAWSPLLPDHRSPGTIDVLLTVVWGGVFLLLAAIAWRDSGKRMASVGDATNSQAADASIG
ncbi:MAG: hypothetical protein ACRBK7_27080 [Acidimicrobiales bacterium]